MKVQHGILSRIVLGAALILAVAGVTKADPVYVNNGESELQMTASIVSNSAKFDNAVPQSESQAGDPSNSNPTETPILFTPEPGSLSLLAVSAILTVIGLIGRRKAR